MPPIGRTAEREYVSEDENIPAVHGLKEENQKEFKVQIVWRNVILMSALHFGAVIGAYHMLTSAKYQTVIAWFVFYVWSGLGITAGAHRLWSHRSYRANFAMRALLCFFQTMAVQNSIYEWSRDHRVHHKFSETDADPHNANRGFFFAHVGWLLSRKHPDVLSKGKTVDLSDLLDDPLVRFQRKHYRLLILLAAVVVPTAVPYFFWSETLFNSFYICVLFRYCYTLNCTWLVNSAAHLYGTTPYDKSINPRENDLVVLSSMGEGYHNYHHTFPWDYSTSELDWKYNWNFTTLFIDFCSTLGWAYDRKRVSSDMINARVKRTGDESVLPEKKNDFIQIWTSRAIGAVIGFSHLWVPFLIRHVIN